MNHLALMMFVLLGLSVPSQLFAKEKAHQPKAKVSASKLFEAVKKMNSQEKTKFVKAAAKLIYYKAKYPALGKAKKTSLILDLLVPSALAAEQDMTGCNWAGFLEVGDGSCRVREYLGLSCPARQHICNPCLFGHTVNENPICYPESFSGIEASRYCYNNARPGDGSDQAIADGRIHVLMDGNTCMDFWVNLQDLYSNVCSGQNHRLIFSDSREDAQDFREACHIVRLQVDILERLGTVDTQLPPPTRTQ